MTFAFAFALAAVVLVGAPYLAHRLRRQRGDTHPFAAVHLVPAAPPRARRRSALEDRALFLVRALAVVGLAFLGASPFVRCSRLSLSRSTGASVALVLVLDDSMSMQAPLGPVTRFERARQGARELIASTREGDSVAVVLAGSPSRVGLAPSTDRGAVTAFLADVPPSDRGTDLEGALTLARGLVSSLPQVDRRIVVLSDLADGNPDSAPLGENSSVPVWNALPELRSDGFDCAVVEAERFGAKVKARLACTPGSERPPRTVEVLLGARVLASGPLPRGATGDVVLALPDDVLGKAEEPGALVARLSGTDAVAADDQAPVVSQAGPGSIAVIVQGDTETAATGGAPVVEQALAALELDVSVRPLPQVPDRSEDLQELLGILIDDPPGLTPEERHALAAFVDRGGVVLFALGPHSALPPLGASFEPFFTHPMQWAPTSSKGADPTSADAPFVESAAGLKDLAAPRRVRLDADDRTAWTQLVGWSDGAPLVLRRSMGRGEVWAVTLPFALDTSDLPLRPAFLALLDAWTAAARARTVPRRTDVGATWRFPAVTHVSIEGPLGAKVAITRHGETDEATPARIGVYQVKTSGHTEARVGRAVERETDLRPRRLAVSAAGRSMGDNHAAIDASPPLAALLVLLLTLEIGLRLRAGRAQGKRVGAPA